MAAEAEMGLPAMRAMFEEWHLPTTEPAGVSYEHVDAGGRRGDVVHPRRLRARTA